MKVQKNLLFITLSLIPLACTHDDELRKELFNVNTRVVALEQELQDKQQLNSRQYVSATGRVGQLQEDIQKLQGEVDRLKVGVQRGELPGQNEREPSVAKQIAAIEAKLAGTELSKLEERVAELEKAQNEILNLLEKMDKKKGATGPKNGGLNNLKAIEHAFQKKRFQDIVDEAPHLLAHKGSKKEELNKIRYFYSESLFKVGNMKEAAISFGELLKSKDHEQGHEPHIRLRLGDCFRNLGDKKTALAYYRQLIEKYPTSTESESAHKYIQKLADR